MAVITVVPRPDVIETLSPPVTRLVAALGVRALRLILAGIRRPG